MAHLTADLPKTHHAAGLIRRQPLAVILAAMETAVLLLGAGVILPGAAAYIIDVHRLRSAQPFRHRKGAR